MRPFIDKRLKMDFLSSSAQMIIAALAIGSCYALATILGVIGARRYAAPNFPIPEDIVSGLLLGTAIWAALTGISFRTSDQNRNHLFMSRRAMRWVLISFLTCTVIPILYFFQQDGVKIFVLWKQFIRSLFFSALSFGLGGVIIGLTAILLHIFYLRILVGLKWGIILTCAIGILLGLCAGWAAYGWTVFSSQALFNLHLSF